jgi:signal transduction histidine kinase
LTTSTLASRVARFQTAVVAGALVVVLGATTLVVDGLLTWKTDQHLRSVLERVAAYVPEATLTEPGWQWLAREIEEVCPSDVRMEVRDQHGLLRVDRGPGSVPATSPGTCSTKDGVRGCALRQAGLLLSAARDGTTDRTIVWQLSAALAATCAAVGFAVALGSGRLTRRALLPLTELGARVQAVEPGSGQRVHAGTELAELEGVSRRFDELIERFEAALSREKRFSAEASHELRTPLTILRGELEELLAAPRADPERAAKAIASIDRLSALVDALLWFGRAQGRLEPERLEIVNLADLIRGEVAGVRQARREQELAVDLPDEALLRADEELLRRAVANLLDNAVKHGDGTRISVELERDHDQLTLRIGNGGKPIPSELREHVFQPFFRPPRGLANGTGFGLGLPLSRAVARAHDGDLILDATVTDRVVMLLRLPLVEWSDG